MHRRPSASKTSRPGGSAAAPAVAGHRPLLLAVALATGFAPLAAWPQPTGAQAIVGAASLSQQGNRLVVTTQNGAARLLLDQLAELLGSRGNEYLLRAARHDQHLDQPRGRPGPQRHLRHAGVQRPARAGEPGRHHGGRGRGGGHRGFHGVDAAHERRGCAGRADAVRRQRRRPAAGGWPGAGPQRRRGADRAERAGRCHRPGAEPGRRHGAGRGPEGRGHRPRTGRHRVPGAGPHRPGRQPGHAEGRRGRACSPARSSTAAWCRRRPSPSKAAAWCSRRSTRRWWPARCRRKALAGAGGSVDVLGDKVGVLAGATIETSNSKGGGQIRVGGDYQGGNPLVANAQVTYVDGNAQIGGERHGQRQRRQGDRVGRPHHAHARHHPGQCRSERRRWRLRRDLGQAVPGRT